MSTVHKVWLLSETPSHNGPCAVRANTAENALPKIEGSSIHSGARQVAENMQGVSHGN